MTVSRVFVNSDVTSLMLAFLPINSTEYCVCRRTCRLWQRLIHDILLREFTLKVPDDVREQLLPAVLEKRPSVLIVPPNKVLANLKPQDMRSCIAMGIDENGESFIALRMKLMCSYPGPYTNNHEWSFPTVFTVPNPREQIIRFHEAKKTLKTPPPTTPDKSIIDKEIEDANSLLKNGSHVRRINGTQYTFFLV